MSAAEVVQGEEQSTNLTVTDVKEQDPGAQQAPSSSASAAVVEQPVLQQAPHARGRTGAQRGSALQGTLLPVCGTLLLSVIPQLIIQVKTLLTALSRSGALVLPLRASVDFSHMLRV